MKAPQSLDEVLSIIGSQCILCEKINWVGKYEYSRRNGNFLIFQCNLGTGHELTAEILFESTIKQIEGILEIISKADKVEESRILYRRLETAVRLLPENSELRLGGRCYRCNEQAVLDIRKRMIAYDCESCKKLGQESYDADIISYD